MCLGVKKSIAIAAISLTNVSLDSRGIYAGGHVKRIKERSNGFLNLIYEYTTQLF